MAAPMRNNVELGFVEKTDFRRLKSRFFPSKVGAKPAWLSFNPLPKPEDLACSCCSRPTVFLLQIYAPGKEDRDFHRTIFVFICKNADCCKPNSNDNIKVFRSQLERKNEFYSFDPPDDSSLAVCDEQEADAFSKLCTVCGCLGPKTCSNCHTVSYCSKAHQTIDWKAGHKTTCSSGEKKVNFTNLLFSELEIVMEPEDYESDQEEQTEKEKMEEYAKYMKSTSGSEHLTEADLEQMAAKESENDRHLRKFKKRISHEPEQVLRYNQGGEPLWIVHSPVPDEVPNCSCGAKRQFEFQILPQLLSHLDVDSVGASIDWGTLSIYTCSANCSTGNNYFKEYVFKQDVS